MQYLPNYLMLLLSTAVATLAQSSSSASSGSGVASGSGSGATAASATDPLISGTTTVTLFGSSTISRPPSTLTASANASSTSSRAVLASATTTVSFPNLGSASPCVLTCLMTAVSNATCQTVIDVDCYCNPSRRAAFSNGMFDCVARDCGADLVQAETLSQQFCNLASGTPSLSFPTSSVSSTSGSSNNTSSGSTTSTGSTSASSGPSSPTGAAMALGTSLDGRVLVGTMLSAFAVVVGGLLV